MINSVIKSYKFWIESTFYQIPKFIGHNGIGGTLSSSNLTSLGGCSPVSTPPSAHIGVS